TYEAPTRALVNELIDGFIEDGRCDFITDFARPLPGLAFFDLVLHAPAEDVREINELATRATIPTNPDARACWEGMCKWIKAFGEQRGKEPARGDVVDAVLAAEIEGRPIATDEIIGVIQLLILGGLETTAGALGQWIIRFAHEPAIPELLRREPER